MDRFIIFAVDHPVLVGLFVVLLILLLITESLRGGKGVTCEELTYLVNSENAVVVDLRDASAFKLGHITRAKNIPQAKLKDRISELNKYKDSPVILVCTHGQQAGAAGQDLTKAGFSNVLRLKGGIQGWSGENLPLVKRK